MNEAKKQFVAKHFSRITRLCNLGYSWDRLAKTVSKYAPEPITGDELNELMSVIAREECMTRSTPAN